MEKMEHFIFGLSGRPYPEVRKLLESHKFAEVKIHYDKKLSPNIDLKKKPLSRFKTRDFL